MIGYRRILLINENELTRTLLDVFHWEGYSVRMLAAMDSVREVIASYCPHVVIINSGIKDATRFGMLCRSLKEDATTNSLPLLVLSALPPSLLPQDTLRCDMLIEKPFDIDDICARVRQLCKDYR